MRKSMYSFDELQSAQRRDPNVGYYQIKLFLRKDVNGRLSCTGGPRRHPTGLNNFAAQTSNELVIIHDEDMGSGVCDLRIPNGRINIHRRRLPGLSFSSRSNMVS